jgi:two-component system, NtrC family, response regulator
MKYRLLIIDDNEQLCRTMTKLAERMDLAAAYETTLKSGLQKAHCENPDIVFLDVNLPDGNGLDAIPELRKIPFPPEIIILTGYPHKDGAKIAIENQAWDYLQKDSSFQNVKLSITRAIQYREQKKATTPQLLLNRVGIVGESEKINICLERVSQAAQQENPVLISGETGTGKEIFSRAIHQNSSRSNGNFVVVDCSALPENLVESTLFGHKKGAFTGADVHHEGLVLQADKGTLFLDEIGELPLNVQKNFLRVLQEKKYRCVGGSTEVSSDFRLICATHRNLHEMVEKKQFRQDLFYRIQAFTIKLPPLRKRTKDILLLVMHRMVHCCRLYCSQPHGVTPEFLEALQTYEWPGNVRELFNTIDSVHAEALNESVLFARHLPPDIRSQVLQEIFENNGTHQPLGPPAKTEETTQKRLPLKEYLDETRHRYIEGLMKDVQGDVAAACRMSGLSRGHLYDLLKKYHIDLKR